MTRKKKKPEHLSDIYFKDPETGRRRREWVAKRPSGPLQVCSHPIFALYDAHNAQFPLCQPEHGIWDGRNGCIWHYWNWGSRAQVTAYIRRTLVSTFKSRRVNDRLGMDDE